MYAITGTTGFTGASYVFTNPVYLNRNIVLQVDASGGYIRSQNDIIVNPSTSTTPEQIKYYAYNKVFINQENGSLVDPSTNLYVNGKTRSFSNSLLSDYRVKHFVEEIDNTIDELEPVLYYNTKNQCRELGLIAQEVEQVIPSLVNGGGNELKSVNYCAIIPLLVKEVQKLKEKVKQLKQSK